MKVYECEKDKLKFRLKDVRRVSLTADCWTSNQTIGYMCLTAHYIDESWKIRKVIINFIELEPLHTGTYICDAICECLLEWNLQDKISTITLDNASNNDVAASSLKANFQSRGKLNFRGYFFHVRCCAHIINIMVQDGLKEIQEIIHNIRESVKYLKKSPTRLHKFVEVAKQLGVPTTRSLSIDVSTRWNSTFNMLESAFIYRNVFNHYAIRDGNYKWLPDDSEWVKYEKIRKFLSVFNNVTKMLSGTLYPTSNIFLPAVLHVKKILMEESFSEDEYMKNMATSMQIKFNKYWGECNLLMSIAAILDPRLKLKFISYTFPKIYAHDEVEQNLKTAQDALWEIYADYVVECNVSNEGFSSTIDHASSSSHFDAMFGFQDFVIYAHDEVEQNLKTAQDALWEIYADYVVECNVSNEGFSSTIDHASSSSHFDAMFGFQDFVVASGSVEPSKPDLQVYLEEGLFVGSNENFDVLDWWKMNTLKYPQLSIMARDILSIPITTVASESAFSAGGRVLDDYRSSLSTKTVNALICASSWIRSTQQNAKTITVVPASRKFKMNGIDPTMEEKLDGMFSGLVATGAHAFTPSEPYFIDTTAVLGTDN
ncbi:zinc finger BED domain-containing protein RICESLEEPER 3-like, partial [Phalaenopsis equestris]|uniref:zinc finger BED domain-containing protein RICESLEEPER 3-like n=1 Tax=Phalaenopsis equestris TaxID=78828 RepID=UPI0009E245BF